MSQEPVTVPSLTLYSGPLSLFSAKVRIALAEKGLAYERVDVPFDRRRGYQPKHPDVVAHNPKGQVPVLQTGDLWLYDSTLILEYLEDRFPDPPLYPREPEAKARCRQLEAAADEILFPPVLVLIREVFYRAGATSGDDEAVASARQAVAAELQRLDHAATTGPYLCGDFSVADVAFYATVLFATYLGSPPAPELEHVHAWLERVGTRPSVQADVAYVTRSMQSLTATAAD